MVSAVSLRFSPSAVKVRVVLRGAVAPKYLDFARLSFHVPISGLLCPSPVCGTAVTSTAAKKINAIDVKANVTRGFIILSFGQPEGSRWAPPPAEPLVNVQVRY